MAAGDREKVLRIKFERLAEPVLRTDMQLFGTAHHSPDAGYGQASLGVALLALFADDLGIDQLPFSLADVDDHCLAENPHLRRSQPDPLVDHRFVHIVKQRPEPFVELGNGPAFFAQALVVFLQDIADCHFSVPPNSAFDLHAVTWFSFDFNEPARAETSTLRSNFHTADRHKARPDGSGSAHGTIAPSAREAPGYVRRRCI